MSKPVPTDNRFEDIDNPEETLRKDIEQAFEDFQNGEINRPAFGELLDGLTAEYYHYTQHTQQSTDNGVV